VDTYRVQYFCQRTVYNSSYFLHGNWKTVACIGRFYFAHMAFPQALFRFCALFFLSSLSLGEVLLPTPNGPYSVAHSVAKFVDGSRVDPYDPDHGLRNVMVSLFYPVERTKCEHVCPINYMPPATAAFLSQVALDLLGVPNGTLQAIKMQVCCKTCPSAVDHLRKYPLVLFSPGLGGTRLTYNVIAQTVASSGYVVATMDHTYDAQIVEYPDGTYTLGKNDSFWDPAYPQRLVDLLSYRVQDARFVLRQLGNLDSVRSLIPTAKEPLNNNSAAFFGHSFGGATAIDTAVVEPSLRGVINMDGGLITNWTAPIHTPTMLLGRADPSPHNRTTDQSWDAVWKVLHGWKREIGVRDIAHNTYTDMALLLKAAGIEKTEAIKEYIGGLDATRSLEIVTTYVRTFMDMVLKGKGSGTIDALGPRFPEVVYGTA
jgi:dienelactone hydrolase